MARVSTTTAGGVGVARTALLFLLLLLTRLPQGSRAQPGGGGSGDGGGGGDGPGGDEVPGEDEGSDASVECAYNGSDAHYDEFLAGEGLTMVRWTGTNTGCPNHVNWPINPNPGLVIAINESIPAYPMLLEDGGTTDLSSAAGTIGLMRNGVSMYSAWALDAVEEYEDTAFYLEADTLDPCGGHATPTGSYHYHSTAGCLQEQAGAVAGEHSPLLGWSYDGFPIYGQLGPGGVEMKMCGADGADSTVCLDLCSGYEASIDEDTFTYRYYTSCGFDESFFPFTLNCYRGCCPTGVTCSDRIEACGDGALIGYTGDHVPVASESLHEPYDALLISGDDEDIIGTDLTVNCTLYLGAGSVQVASGVASDDTAAPPTPAPIASGGGGGGGGGGSVGDAPTPPPQDAAGEDPTPPDNGGYGSVAGSTPSPEAAATPSPSDDGGSVDGSSFTPSPEAAAVAAPEVTAPTSLADVDASGAPGGVFSPTSVTAVVAVLAAAGVFFAA
ncbi:conserved unknown protein [Ectocarpus siliculosus]|uniref:YHYH domain-containing protein n=1 Tax=Ectocarpus siliculosus TaxID=2880 RepID=D7FUL4_ECTSI|nr:conserved unknown protein [Ectocarpus siliculosus]|eukprot:CBJ31670.1 conserved unknown protein [Ectocarpus siliculosus]